MHEPDHAYDEPRRHQHHPAFEDVLVELQVVQHDSGRRRSPPPPRPSAQNTVFFSSFRPILVRYANTIPTISEASTPSRSVMINACSISPSSRPGAPLAQPKDAPADLRRMRKATLTPVPSLLRTNLVVNQTRENKHAEAHLLKVKFLKGVGMVRPEGFEPPAYWFVASRSIQLSYGRTSQQQLF